MLNIDVSINVKKTRYPIIFTNNTCTMCGATDTLRFVDVFGRRTREEIHPLEKIQCSNCGAKYGIQWDMHDDGKMYPTPTDYDASVMFGNLIRHTFVDKKRYSKEI